MMIFIDHLGEWKAPDAWPASSAREMAYQMFQALDEMDLSFLGTHDDGEIPYVRFAPDAQALADQWRDELEQRLRGDTLKDAPAFEAHLGKYRSLMPSLALIFHLLDTSVKPISQVFEKKIFEVPLDAVELAADWCEYLEAHARAVYQAEVAPGIAPSHRLAEKIKAGHIHHCATARDIYRHQWPGLTTSAHVNAGLEVLESVGWVKVVSQPTGGTLTTLVHLHPDPRGGKDT
jgi:hypothetical protein